MSDTHNVLHTLINHHFCIRNVSSADVLNVLDATDTEYIECERLSDAENFKTLMTFLYDENINKEDKHFLLFEPVNHWSYLMWNVWDFDRTKQMALNLSLQLGTQVFYFFIDPWIFTYRYILAEKGQIIKAYFQSHGKDVVNVGYLEQEDDIRKKLKEDKNHFWEDEYWNLNEILCQRIDVINSSDTIKVTKGVLK